MKKSEFYLILIIIGLMVISCFLAVGLHTANANPDARDSEIIGADIDKVEVWFSSVEDQEPIIGHVTHHNKKTFGAPAVQRYILDSPDGEIMVKVNRTPNINCQLQCADTISVLELPDGYVAIPTEVITPEGSVANLKIMRYSGS